MLREFVVGMVLVKVSLSIAVVAIESRREGD